MKQRLQKKVLKQADLLFSTQPKLLSHLYIKKSIFVSLLFFLKNYKIWELRV
jgi:hypothetical protein